MLYDTVNLYVNYTKLIVPETIKKEQHEEILQGKIKLGCPEIPFPVSRVLPVEKMLNAPHHQHEKLYDAVCV